MGDKPGSADATSHVDRTSGFFFGCAIGVSIFSILISNERIDRWFDRGSPVPAKPGVIAGSVILASIFVWTIAPRHWMAA